MEPRLSVRRSSKRYSTATRSSAASTTAIILLLTSKSDSILDKRILRKLKEQRALHDETHHEFYDLEIDRRAHHRIHPPCRRWIEALACQEKRQLAENLHTMAAINHRLATELPKTFRRGYSMEQLVQHAEPYIQPGSSGGQIEDLFNPFYERDVASGILTDEEAIFYLARMFLQDAGIGSSADPMSTTMIKHVI